MAARPPFHKTLLSLLVSGAAMTMPEARAAQCETTTDAEGNVTTVSGTCNGYRNNTTINGDFTNTATIEAPNSTANGIRISDSYVENLFNNGLIIGQGENKHSIYLKNSLRGSLENNADINGVRKGLRVNQQDISFNHVINRGDVTTYASVIQVSAKGNMTAGDIVNEGSLITEQYPQGVDEPAPFEIEDQHGIDVSVRDNAVTGNIINTASANISAIEDGIHAEVKDNGQMGNIENQGSILSEQGSGIYVQAEDSALDSITNSGTIASDDAGIRLDIENVTLTEVINSGRIETSDINADGIRIDLDNSTIEDDIINSGTIISSDEGLRVDAENESRVNDVINTGTIEANDYAMYIQAVDDSHFNDIINRGSLVSEKDYGLHLDIEDSSSVGRIVNESTGSILTQERDPGIEIDIEGNSAVGSIINEGTITAESYGINVSMESSALNTLTNTGTITTTDREGIYISITESEVGDIANSGTITAFDDGIYFYADNGSNINSLTNSGTINAGDEGIEFETEDEVTINALINSGNITSDSDGVYAYFYESSINSVLNEGQIASGDEGVDLELEESHIGSVANSGTIIAEGKGIDIELEDGSTLGSIVNSGTITANEHGIEVDADGNSVFVQEENPAEGLNFTLLNTGDITSNRWHGIMFEGTMEATVGNSGTITGQQNGIGLYRDHGFNNNEGPQSLTISIDNVGTITSAAGQGIYLGQDATGSITNTGTISTTSSGDIFADYGVPVATSSDPFEGFTQVVYENNEGLPEGTSLYKSDTSDWYAVQREEVNEQGTRQVIQYFQSDNTTENMAAFIAGDDNLVIAHDLKQPVFTRLLQADIEEGEETFDYMNLRNGLDWLVDGPSSGNAVTPRYIDASAIKLYGTLEGNISNSGTLSSTGGSAIGATGGLTGTLINEGTIEGGVFQATPEFYTPWPEAEEPDFGGPQVGPDSPEEVDSLLDEEFQVQDIIPGIAVNQSDIGPQAGDRVAIDFSRAQTSMNLEQVGTGASILGDVWGQATGPEGNDSATFGFSDAQTGLNVGGGSMAGDLYGVEDVLVQGGNFTFTGNSYARNGEDNNFTVASSGTLILGTHTGTQIEGDYTQTGGLVTSVGNANSVVNNVEAVAALSVGDTATISGTMTVNPIWSEFSYSRTAVEKYHVVNAQQTDYTGSLANQATVLFSQNISEENDTDVYLNMTSNDLETEVEDASGNQTYGELARGLQDALVAQGASSELFQQLLDVADGQALSDIIEDAVTNNDGSEALLAEALQDGVFNNILNRLAETRSGQGGVSFGEATPWHGGVWLKALMVKADQAKQRSGSTTFNGYKSNTKGFTLGYDVDLSDQWTVGMAWSYANSTMEVKNSNDETTTKSYQFSLYGNWQHGDWFIDTIVNAGINKNDSSRVSGGNTTYKADFDSKQYGLRIVAGKAFWFNDKDTLVEPQLLFNYSHLSTDKYKEKASGQSDITVKSSDYEVLELGAGVRFSHLFELDSSILLPEASIKAFYDFKGDTMTQDVNVNILNTSLNYRTTGIETQRMTYQSGVGLSWWLDNSVTLSMNYDRTWRSGFSADSIQAKIRYDF